MCGIIGYTGPRQAIGILLKGLENLEYRGYDSAGVSILNNVEDKQEFVRQAITEKMQREKMIA